MILASRASSSTSGSLSSDMSSMSGCSFLSLVEKAVDLALNPLAGHRDSTVAENEDGIILTLAGRESTTGTCHLAGRAKCGLRSGGFEGPPFWSTESLSKHLHSFRPHPLQSKSHASRNAKLSSMHKFLRIHRKHRHEVDTPSDGVYVSLSLLGTGTSPKKERNGVRHGS